MGHPPKTDTSVKDRLKIAQIKQMTLRMATCQIAYIYCAVYVPDTMISHCGLFWHSEFTGLMRARAHVSAGASSDRRDDRDARKLFFILLNDMR